MDDLKPFVHGSEGTHSACEKIVERGAKMECCGCSGHKCKDNEDDEETECPECGGELIKGKCKNWLDFLKNETGNKKSKQERIKNIQAYVEKYLSRELTYEEIEKICPDEIIKYERLKSDIFNLMKQADSVATSIRDKIKSYEEN